MLFEIFTITIVLNITMTLCIIHIVMCSRCYVLWFQYSMFQSWNQRATQGSRDSVWPGTQIPGFCFLNRAIKHRAIGNQGKQGYFSKLKPLSYIYTAKHILHFHKMDHICQHFLSNCCNKLWHMYIGFIFFCSFSLQNCTDSLLQVSFIPVETKIGTR